MIDAYNESDDYNLAKASWVSYLERNNSIITDLMAGQFKSKLECPNEKCKNISVQFNSFNTLSLPIP